MRTVTITATILNDDSVQDVFIPGDIPAYHLRQIAKAIMGQVGVKQHQAFQQFIDSHGLKLLAMVNEERATASIAITRGEMKDSVDSSVLHPAHGHGKSYEEAIANLVENISGKILVINADGADRVEIPVPIF